MFMLLLDLEKKIIKNRRKNWILSESAALEYVCISRIHFLIQTILII